MIFSPQHSHHGAGCAHDHEHHASYQRGPVFGTKSATKHRRTKKQGPEKCATRELTKRETISIEKRIKALNARDSLTTAATKSFEPVTIQTSFHIIYDPSSGSGSISDATVDAQMQVLNDSFGPYGFKFALREVVRTGNLDFYSLCGPSDERFKAALHDAADGADVLYLYFCPLDDLLGYATFPIDFTEKPILDGVVNDVGTVPGGSTEFFDLGFTAVHEVGHWLGLLHTFQGGCGGSGDYIDDTPAQGESTSGCPALSDTCPDEPGFDPVTNYMDYSDDICFEEFTAGQADRMQKMWRLYREGTSAMEPPIPVTIDVPLTGISLETGSRQRFIVEDIPIFSLPSVTLTGDNGDADLFVSLCSSLSPGSSNEKCTGDFSFLEEGPLFIEVIAVAAFTNLTMTVMNVAPTFESLALGETITNSLPEGDSIFYAVEVPENSALQVEINGDNGDADIYVVSGSNEFDPCLSYLDGSNETCVVYVLEPSTVYVVVEAFFSFTNASLTADVVTEFSIQALESGTPATDISLDQGGEQLFVVNNIPSGSTIKIETTDGMFGDADLLVYMENLGNEVCESFMESSAESCEVNVNSETKILIRLVAFSSFAGVSLTATVTTPSTAYSILMFILNIFVQVVLSGSEDF